MNSITPRSETEALLLEKFQALLNDLDTAAVIAFAVAKSSYETAAFQLKEFGCLTVSHQSVSNFVPSLSDEVQSKLTNNDAVRQAFQEAKGDVEFTADGVFGHISCFGTH